MDSFARLTLERAKAAKRRIKAAHKEWKKKSEKREANTYGINKHLKTKKRKLRHEALDTTQEK